MAVIIFLWLGKDGYHASLNIDDRPQAAQSDRYISFYPKGKGFATVTGTPSIGQSVSYDTANFKQPPEYASAPILGLDEDAIIAWWRRNRGVVQFSALSNNCSDVVLNALEAGGANQRGPAIVSAIQRARRFVTTPDSIRSVADLLAATNPPPPKAVPIIHLTPVQKSVVSIGPAPHSSSISGLSSTAYKPGSGGIRIDPAFLRKQPAPIIKKK